MNAASRKKAHMNTWDELLRIIILDGNHMRYVFVKSTVGSNFLKAANAHNDQNNDEEEKIIRMEKQNYSFHFGSLVGMIFVHIYIYICVDWPWVEGGGRGGRGLDARGKAWQAEIIWFNLSFFHSFVVKIERKRYRRWWIWSWNTQYSLFERTIWLWWTTRIEFAEYSLLGWAWHFCYPTDKLTEYSELIVGISMNDVCVINFHVVILGNVAVAEANPCWTDKFLSTLHHHHHRRIFAWQMYLCNKDYPIQQRERERGGVHYAN